MIVLVLIGLILTTLQVVLALRFLRGTSGQARVPVLPHRVSILKPVCGLDDELEENLLSFTQLEGIDYELIISAEEADDPALAVARRVMEAHPDAPFRIVIDGGSRAGVVNRKVERLIAAARAAAGNILWISDSNVRVERDAYARTLGLFDDANVGCVSNLFTGAGASTLGSTIESLHLLGFVVPGAAAANAIGVPCVVGKSMALRRETLEAIGGFERFVRVLAEDQAIGRAVKAAGYDLRLSPVVVRDIVVQRSVQRAVHRQVRWNKIRYSFSHRLYACELLANPLPFALFAPPLLPVVMAMRWLQFLLLNRATGARMTWAQLAAVPLLDLIMCYAWFVPFFSKRVTWRGYRASLGRDTELIQIAAG